MSQTQIVKMAKPRTGINVAKILSGAAVGLILGASYCGITEVARLGKKEESPLDPPAPNMEEINSELTAVFRTFMGSFYKMCPNKNKKKFKKHVQEAIEFAEDVMVIENQLRRGEIKNQGFKDRSDAQGSARECMKSLRQVIYFFETGIIEKVVNRTDHVQIILSDSLTNISNMTE